MNKEPSIKPTGSALLSTAEVLAKLGIGETTLWRMEKRGEFPKAIMLSRRCKRWRESDVDTFIESAGRA